MLTRLASWCFRRRKATVGIWVGALVISGIALGAIGPGFDGAFQAPDSEAKRGFDVFDKYFGGVGSGLSGSIVFEADSGVDDPAVVAAMTELFETTADLEGVVDVRSPYAPFNDSQIAENGKIAFADIQLSAEVNDTEGMAIGQAIGDALPDVDGLDVEVGGSVLGEFEPPQTEMIGLSFAVVVLILAFGSVLAMGLPIGVAVMGVALGLILTSLVSNLQTMPEFSTTIGAMIGLGVGIDYALFIVTRYRDALHRGLSAHDATVEAMDTSGRAVVFAGITVVVSLLGMLIIGLPFVSGLGIASALTVAVTMIASITLLPSFLGFAGDRIEMTRRRGLIAAALGALGLLGNGLNLPAIGAFGFVAAVAVLLSSLFVKWLRAELPPRTVKPMRETTAYRWSRQVQNHPWLSVLVGSAILLVVAAPVLSLRMGFSDEGNYPEGSTTREAYDLISEGFGPGFNGPLLVTVTSTDDQPVAAADVTAVYDALVAAPGIESVDLPTSDTTFNLMTKGELPAVPDDFEPTIDMVTAQPANAYMIRAIPETSPQAEETEALVERLRSEDLADATAGRPIETNLTGMVAVSVDFTTYMAERMVVFLAVVLALSFLLLMAVFRSLLVPLKAVIMNVLSIAAAYGAVVAVFQWGWFGVEPAPIEPFVPMMMFAIVFGLSMDYEVFLLSRVKEEYDRTGDPVTSVADGLAATARVITAAAAIMVVVFGSFMFEENRITKLFGMGLAIAVLLDATLVRMLLVPATMELLGSRNWWLPKWLDRLLPRLSVEGPSHVHDEVIHDGSNDDGATATVAVDDDRDPVGTSA